MACNASSAAFIVFTVLRKITYVDLSQKSGRKIDFKHYLG